MCEIFATLHMPEEKRLVMQWAREDQVLRKKMEYMEGMIARYWEETAPDAQTAGAASRPAEAAENAENGDVAEEAEDTAETAEPAEVR